MDNKSLVRSFIRFVCNSGKILHNLRFTERVAEYWPFIVLVQTLGKVDRNLGRNSQRNRLSEEQNLSVSFLLDLVSYSRDVLSSALDYQVDLLDYFNDFHSRAPGASQEQ